MRFYFLFIFALSTLLRKVQSDSHNVTPKPQAQVNNQADQQHPKRHQQLPASTRLGDLFSSSVSSRPRPRPTSARDDDSHHSDIIRHSHGGNISLSRNVNPPAFGETRRQHPAPKGNRRRIPIRDKSDQESLCLVRLYVDTFIEKSSTQDGHVDMDDRLVFLVPLMIIYWRHRHPTIGIPFKEINNLLLDFGDGARTHRLVLQEVMRKVRNEQYCSKRSIVVDSNRQMFTTSATAIDEDIIDTSVDTPDATHKLSQMKASEALRLFKDWLEDSERPNPIGGSDTLLARQSGSRGEIRIWFQALANLGRRRPPAPPIESPAATTTTLASTDTRDSTEYSNNRTRQPSIILTALTSDSVSTTTIATTPLLPTTISAPTPTTTIPTTTTTRMLIEEPVVNGGTSTGQISSTTERSITSFSTTSTEPFGWPNFVNKVTTTTTSKPYNYAEQQSSARHEMSSRDNVTTNTSSTNQQRISSALVNESGNITLLNRLRGLQSSLSQMSVANPVSHRIPSAAKLNAAQYCEFFDLISSMITEMDTQQSTGVGSTSPTTI